MHRSTTGEIQAAHIVNPTGWVPCPAGNGIIDNGGPNEHKDNAGGHATTFRNAAYGQSNTNRMIQLVNVCVLSGVERGTHVIAANMPWKIANIRSGILGLPTDGRARTPLKPKFAKSPKNFPAVWEKVREN